MAESPTLKPLTLESLLFKVRAADDRDKRSFSYKISVRYKNSCVPSISKEDKPRWLNS